MRAGLLDEMYVAISPILLGRGARLFDNLEGAPASERTELVSGPSVTHVRLRRSA